MSDETTTPTEPAKKATPRKDLPEIKRYVFGTEDEAKECVVASQRPFAVYTSKVGEEVYFIAERNPDLALSRLATHLELSVERVGGGRSKPVTVDVIAQTYAKMDEGTRAELLKALGISNYNAPAEVKPEVKTEPQPAAKQPTNPKRK